MDLTGKPRDGRLSCGVWGGGNGTPSNRNHVLYSVLVDTCDTPIMRPLIWQLVKLIVNLFLEAKGVRTIAAVADTSKFACTRNLAQKSQHKE